MFRPMTPEEIVERDAKMARQRARLEVDDIDLYLKARALGVVSFSAPNADIQFDLVKALWDNGYAIVPFNEITEAAVEEARAWFADAMEDRPSATPDARRDVDAPATATPVSGDPGASSASPAMPIRVRPRSAVGVDGRTIR